VIVTEYTSFAFGDLDAGQEANAQTGFALDVAAMLLSHYANGVDAALYWDAVDYLQPGHDAITKWGLLRGPAYDFQRRQRYYAFSQLLPYLEPGTRVLSARQQGGDSLTSLAVRDAHGVPVIMLVNQEFNPLDITLTLSGSDSGRYESLTVTRTDRTRKAEPVGRVRLQDGVGQFTLPPRSVSTLFPAGTDPLPDTSA
jgi:hypothetical protein